LIKRVVILATTIFGIYEVLNLKLYSSDNVDAKNGNYP
jgi:hypothetical protein